MRGKGKLLVCVYVLTFVLFIFSAVLVSVWHVFVVSPSPQVYIAVEIWQTPSAKWGCEMGKSQTSTVCLGSIKDMYALNAVPRNCFVVEVFLFT